MDPHLPFLRAIAANPADDLPRLVYADFLEETGEPVHVARAHFIRTQIALESLYPQSQEHRGAKGHSDRLFDMYRGVWVLDLPDHLQKRDRLTWRRGFVDDLGPMTVNDFLTFGAAAFWELPLTSLHLSGRSETFHFDRHPELERVARLTFTNFRQLVSPLEVDLLFPTRTFNSLVTAPVFTALRTLNLSGNGLTDAWLVRFVSAFPKASFAATLEELDLSHCHTITDAGANTLATAHSLGRLKRIRLVGVPLSGAAVAMMRHRFEERLVV